METNEGDHLSQQPTVNVKAETEKDVTSGHTCGVCGCSFPLLSSLSQHMRSHTQEKPYKCPHCEHWTAQKDSLKDHIRSHKLGLSTQNLCDKDGDQEKNKAPEIPDSLLTGSDKAVPVSGKVKRKRTKERAKDSNGMENSGETESSNICSICGQVFPQARLLKSHMKAHCDSEDYRCRICGRRFRYVWFLQSHMRFHQVKEQLKVDSEPPVTINGVPQDPASLRNDVCLYEICGICGNFFPDLNALQIHEKLHKVNHSYTETQTAPQGDTNASDMQAEKIRFMAALNLKPVAPKEAEENKLGGRIPQLDPITSYQALQLATRGRLATVNASALKYLGRVKDKKKRVLVKKDKKRKQTNTPGRKNKKAKRETDLNETSESTAQPKGGGKTNCQKSVKSKYQEGNMAYFCEYCDFRTVTIALLRSHVNNQHPEVVDVSGLPSGNKAIMDYIIYRKILLSQYFGNPSTSTPGHGSAESKTDAEKSNDTDVKGLGDTSFTGTNLDLAPRSQCTQPPDIPAHSSSVKHITRLQSGTLKRKYVSKDLCS